MSPAVWQVFLRVPRKRARTRETVFCASGTVCGPPDKHRQAPQQQKTRKSALARTARARGNSALKDFSAFMRHQETGCADPVDCQAAARSTSCPHGLSRCQPHWAGWAAAQADRFATDNFVVAASGPGGSAGLRLAYRDQTCHRCVHPRHRDRRCHCLLRHLECRGHAAPESFAPELTPIARQASPPQENRFVESIA